MNNSKSQLSRLGAVGISIVLSASMLSVGAASPSSATAIPANDLSKAGANWLSKQNPGTNGSLLTSNIIGLTSVKVGRSQTQQWLDTFKANVGSYVDVTSGQAGALGKSIFAVEAQNADSSNFGGKDLPGMLIPLMQGSSDDNPGRFSDPSPVTGTDNDYSSGYTQAWDVLGLARTAGGAPSESIEYLLSLQCANGGFSAAYATNSYGPGPDACASNADADLDTTSLAVQALLSPGIKDHPGAAAAATNGAGYLESTQDPSGAWSGWGGLNTNSTGLAAQALRAAGRTASANKSSKWLNTMFINCANAGTGPATKDYGALAPNPDALNAALKSGIGGARPNWVSATQQGITGMASAAPLSTLSASNQSYDLPALKCDPNKPKITKVKKYRNGKARVYFTGPKVNALSGPATAYKYRVRYAGKKWSKSWKNRNGNARYISLPKAKVRSKSRGEVRAKYRTVTRYVQLRAVNAAGQSQVAKATVRQKVRVRR